MSKPNKKRYKMAQIRQGYVESGESVIEFDAPNGDTYTVPAPGFWPDEVHEATKGGDSVALAKALLAEQYVDYRAAGGQADDIQLLLKAWAEDQGVTLPES